MDKHTPEQRRYNMSQVKRKHKDRKNANEGFARLKHFFTHHRADVFGKPDIVFKRKKIAVFIDSDFWHGKKHIPKSNQEFWIARFERNRNHDEGVNTKLTEQGWTVLRFGKEEIKKDLESCLNKILIVLRSD